MKLSANIKILILAILPSLIISTLQISYVAYFENHRGFNNTQHMLNVYESDLLSYFNTSQDSIIPILALISCIGLVVTSCIVILIFHKQNTEPENQLRSYEKPDQEKNITESPLLINSYETTETKARSVNSSMKKQLNCSDFSVLIADDNHINRLLLTNQLEGRCKNITVAKDGTEALHFLMSQHYDLILLDLQMPGYSGHDLIQMIRNGSSLNQNSPIIAITAHAQLSQRNQIIAEGFDECIIKPILTEHLDEIISLWQPQAERFECDKSQLDYVNQILNKTNQNIALAITIAEKLFTELPEQLDQIELAIKTDKSEVAVEVTHKLHGSVSFCGLINIQKPARSLEENLLSQDYPKISKLFNSLKNSTLEFIESKDVILKELTSLSNR